MKETGLTLIKGGREENLAEIYRFIDAEVTNTRLMGVLGLHIHWRRSDVNIQPDVHQFFYFDIEELGLDSLTVYLGDEEDAVAVARKTCFGGLGAEMVSVSEKEARYLANFFIEDTLRKGEKLPDGVRELDYVTKLPQTLCDEEKEALLAKLCVRIKSDFGLINYYLMRLFGHDEEAAAFLRHKAAPPENFSEIAPGLYSTFLRNEIQSFKDEDGTESYLCESLIENDRGHCIVFSEIMVKDGRVFYAKKRSHINISDSEASMKLARDEYVTSFDITDDMDLFDVKFAAYSIGTTQSGYDAGEMFMEFKKDNSHVEQKLYNLNDDVQTVFFVSDCGQLVIAAYSIEAIVAAEFKLKLSTLWSGLAMTGKYHFAESLIYDYAVSGIDDFGEYLKSLDWDGQ